MRDEVNVKHNRGKNVNPGPVIWMKKIKECWNLNYGILEGLLS
jgi:hypothetical protein